MIPQKRLSNLAILKTGVEEFAENLFRIFEILIIDMEEFEFGQLWFSKPHIYLKYFQHLIFLLNE